MRFLSSGFSAVLCGGLLLAAGAAHAQRLDSAYNLIDQNDPNDNDALFLINGTTFFVNGHVQGTGTAGDLVEIGYVTDAPTNVSADDKQARIRQSSFSALTLLIESDTPARDLDLGLELEKCQIDAKVQAEKNKGDVTMKCSADDLFVALTADQEASLQAAFLDNKQVKIKVDSDGAKGSISIKLKGTASVTK